MAYYLVEAMAKEERLPELVKRLEKDEFLALHPFGVSVTFSLRGARKRPDGGVVWRRRTIAHHHSPRNARRYSTSTSRTFASHPSREMRAGLRSVIYRHFFPI